MPGTMSKEMPAARSAAISSPARPKISGSPDFSRTTRWPARASRDDQRVDLVLADGMGALGLADVDAARVAAALRHDRLGHQPVVDDDVGLLQRALGAQRQQVLGARAGADQRDVAGPDRVDLERAQRLLLGLVDAAGKDLLGDRAGEEARPEAAAVGDGGERRASRARGAARRARRDRRRPAPAVASMRARTWRASTGATPSLPMATASGARLTSAGV